MSITIHSADDLIVTDTGSDICFSAAIGVYEFRYRDASRIAEIAIEAAYTVQPSATLAHACSALIAYANQQ